MNLDLLEVEMYGTNGVAVLQPSGVLTTATYPMMRDVLLKTVLAQPAAVVVDLGSLVVEPQEATSVFRAVWAQVAEWPGVPILLAAGGGRPTWFLPSYETVADALAHVGERPRRWVVRMPLPLTGGAVFARLAAEETCRMWGLRKAAPTVASVAAALADVITRDSPIRPVIIFEWWRDALVVGATEDATVRVEPAELSRAVSTATGMEPRCGWSTTWSDGTLIWAVLTA